MDQSNDAHSRSQQNLIKRFLEHLQFSKRFSKHTILAYRADLDQFFSFLKETYDDSKPDCISYHQIRSYIIELSSNDYSNRSINRKIVSLRSFFKFLKMKDIVNVNPCDKLVALKTPKRLPAVVKESEMLNLYDAVFIGEPDFVQHRDFSIIELLYSTGIRRAELINIELVDLNLKQGLLKVMGKGKKERIIPINNSMTDVLNRYLQWRSRIELEDETYLFVSASGRKLYPKAIYNIVKKYLSLITTIDKKSPHVLRHSFATHITDRGAELNAVKKILGHASLAATQIYTHNSVDQLRKIYKTAHPKG